MRAARFWAQEGGKPIVLANNLDFCDGLWQAYKEEAAQAGRSARGAPPGAGSFPLPAAANALLRSSKSTGRYGINGFYHSTRYAMAIGGTSDEVSRQIETAYNRLQFNKVHLQVGQGYLEKDEVIDELELFASQVVPRFN
jgi:hypothetical protein